MLAFSTLAAPLPRRLSVGRVSVTAPLRPLPPRHAVMALDPHTAHSALSHLLSVNPPSPQALSLLLSDASAAVSSTVDAAAATAEVAATTTTEAAKSGVWNSFVHLIETALVSCHNLLDAAGVPGAYGLSIILFTLGIKLLTFPLNFRQMESTMKMQALAPRLRKIQADYKDNPAVMNQMTADLYKTQNVNPLAGCLPVFVQIPIWIALYRSVLNLAADNLLNESFLWLPSLQGPVSQTGKGLDVWLFPLIDGAPPVGWHDAICYLVLPVLLVATQFYSQQLIQPPASDPQTKQANNFLKFMPLLIGWFSLNVPSGLGIYWVTNNLLSTAQTLYIRSKFPDLSNPAATTDDDDDDDESGLDPVDGFQAATPTKSSANKSSKSKKRRKRR